MATRGPARDRAHAFIARGNAAAESGTPAEAARFFREAINADPFCAEAHRCLGIALHAAGDPAAAIGAHRQAIALDPSDAANHYNLGLACLAASAPDAEKAFRHALAARAEFPEAWVGLAEAVEGAGRDEEAMAALDSAIAQRENYAGALINSSLLLRKLGRIPEADARLRSVDVNGLLLARRHEEAEWVAREMTQRLPEDWSGWRILGAVLAVRRDFEAAAIAFGEAAGLQQEDAETHHNLALCFQSLGRYSEAERSFRRALQLKPGYADAYDNLANVLFSQGRIAEAESACRRAIELMPGSYAAHSDLGRILDALGRTHDALQSYRMALELNPASPIAHNNLAAALVTLGRVDQAEASCRRALELKPDYREGFDNLLFILNYHPDKTPQEVFADYREFDTRFGVPAKAGWLPHANDRRPERRLRVGYVSPDFRMHAASKFIEPLFDRHDRSCVELFAYSETAMEDDVTARLRSKADGWVATHGIDDAKLADRIRADGIDVLVDLAGHTRGNRLPLFARKPAPMAVTTIGFACTTGLSAIDWILTDGLIFPVGAEGVFSEKPWRLPIYQVYRPAGNMGDPGELPALKRGFVTFGTLTRAARLNHRVIRVWSELLRRLPSARLCIDSLDFREAQSCDEIARQFSAHGIDKGRIELGFHSPPWDVMRNFDIGLDCFPQNSGTTLFDSLYMGIPFVTLKDRPPLGRLGQSIATAIGHPEWVAGTEEDYVSKAAALAENPAALSGLRRRLRGDMLASRLMDEAHYVTSVESAYREMWRRWCAKPVK